MRAQTKKFTIELIEGAILIIGLVVFCLTISPRVESDGVMRLAVVEALLEGKGLAAVKYSLVMPVLSLPLAYVSSKIGLGVEWGCSHFNIGILLIFCPLIFIELTKIFSARVACATLLVLLATSMFPHHLMQYFAELPSVLFIVYGGLLASRRPYLCAVLLGVGVSNTPALIFPAAVASLILLRERPCFLVGLILALAIYAFENYLKFGRIGGSSYFSAQEAGFKTILPYSGEVGFSYPIFFGILSVVISFGKGLIFFIPGLLLFCRKDTWLLTKLTGVSSMALCGSAAALVLIYAKWWAWYGGAFWGPRFFLLLTVPAALAMAVHIHAAKTFRKTFILAVLLSFSIWVGIDGVVFGQRNMDVCFANNYQYEFLCWYVPEFSALWRPFVVFDLRELLIEISKSEACWLVYWQVVVWVYFVGIAVIATVREVKKSSTA